MTICIAAVAEKRHIVMAADRTLTLTLEPEVFAHRQSSKLYEVNPGFLIGVSGSPLHTPEFLDELRPIGKKGRSMIDRISDALLQVRRKEMERGILHRFALDYEDYEDLIAKQSLSEVHARIIGEQMDEYHVCMHVVAGVVDARGKASVFSADDCNMIQGGRVPKGVFCHDSVGWVSTGSGSDYADEVLAEANVNSETPLDEVIFHVFEAKKNSEQALGVGRETDIRVILSAKKNVRLTADQITALEKLRERKKARAEKIQAGSIGEARKLLAPVTRGKGRRR